MHFYLQVYKYCAKLFLPRGFIYKTANGIQAFVLLAILRVSQVENVLLHILDAAMRVVSLCANKLLKKCPICLS